MVGAGDEAEPIEVRVTGDRSPPLVSLGPVRSARPREPLRVTASVVDLSGITSVRLRYRHLTQFEDYETLEMEFDSAAGAHTATIPGEFIVPKWDLMYFVEAIDAAGNGCIAPDLDVETPYVIVELER